MPHTVKRLLNRYSRLRSLERSERRRSAPDPKRLAKLDRLQELLRRRIALSCIAAA